MKKVSSIVSILFTVFLFVCSVASAQQTDALQLVSNSGKSLNIKFEAPSLSFNEVETPNGVMSIPALENGSPLLEKGAPDLQKFACSYIIPDGENPKVEIITATYKDYKIEVAPSKGNLLRNVLPSEVAYIFGDEYEHDVFYPTTIFAAQNTHIVRDFNAQALWVYPMQYNPISKILRVYNSIELEISFDSNISFPRTVDSQYNMIYKDLFMNYEVQSKSTIDTEDGSMLIISYDEFMDPMADFMAWKTQKGIANEIVDVASIGGQDEIKAYIEDYYANNNLTYVLFVGDHEHVPAYEASSGYSDNYYGYLEGDDSYPEVIVGRFSAEDKDHVTTQVSRVIQYEQNPPITDAYAESVVVGSDQGPGDDGEYDYQHLRNIQAQHLEYTYTTGYELFDGSQGGADADGNPSASDLHVLLEDDLGIINYTGHGSTVSCGSSGYSSNQVNELTNTLVHPFFWSVACVNGNFTGTTCFGEAWLRATHNGQPTGAIATLMSTINQSWSPPMEGQDHMNFILTEASENSDARSFGGISMNGCMQMNDTYGASGASMTDTWTCFGDPSVIVRTQAPESMAVSYNPAIPVGSTSLDVSCSTEGALVSLTLDGEIIGTAVVSGGSATVNFEAISSVSDITVTVTAFNSVPSIGTASVVVLDGPWLVVTSYELSGDEDGMFSYGESYDLHFTVENIGTEPASDIGIQVSYDGPILIMTFGDFIPAIEAGESYTYTGAYFPTSINSSMIDGDEGIVNFSMSSVEGTWNSTISIPLHAPVLEVTNVDAQLSFGETTTANITLTNNGSAHFNGGTATFSVDETYLSVVDDAITVESLASGESITLAYNVLLDADAPSSTFIDVSIVVTEGWFEQSSDFVLETPMCQSSDLDIELTIMTDTWGYETSWDFTNAEGVILASVEAGSYGNSSTYTAAVCAAEGSMMTFNIADTYGDGINSPNGYWLTVCGNEVAQGDAFGSGASETFVVTCDIFIEVPGCMDPEADNYNSEANLDDGTCVYTIDCETANPLQLTLIDSWGDGWNGNYFELYDVDNNQLVSTTLEEGSEALFDFCLNDGCYTITTTNGGSYTNEVSWILTIGNDTISTGVSPSSNAISLNTDCGFVNGCMDIEACNYNENANIDDATCSYADAYYSCEGVCLSDVDADGTCDELEVYGCTDIDAANYEVSATEEDGSCVYAEDCNANFVVVNMVDSFGDGWNGNMLYITNSALDTIASLTIVAGSAAQQTLCLDNDCYLFTTTDDGGWPYEVSWSLVDATTTELLSGTAPSNFGLSLGATSCDFSGCTDELASNYEPNAIEDDGSCEYEECICLDVWDPVCGVDGITYGNSCEADCVGLEYVEGECTLVVIGCTDETAINYNPDATEDDGTCEYDSTGCTEGQIEDCNGNCAPLSWVGDGVCDDGNFTSDGNSIYFTCEEFDFDGGDCSDVTIVYGCTDVTALNYNPEANTDDDSCEYEQTEGPWDVLITGSNHTIAVGGDTPIMIEDMPIENGDWIGVFYTNNNGDLICAGYAAWNGETNAIPAQGDDSTTDEIDGFQNGEVFTWMIWDASEDVVYNANATYMATMPSLGDFEINGISGVESLNTVPAISEQVINLPTGWSLFSTYMLSNDMDVVSMLSEINSDVIIVKDNAGLAYLPDWAFNGIGEMQVGQGYQIKMEASVNLTVLGTYMSPEENPITLNQGWNLLGCLRLEASDVIAVFADIVDEVIIVKNSAGLAYLPEWDFNGIGTIDPGQGYQVKMVSTQVLTYLANNLEYRTSNTKVINNQNLKHFAVVKPTDTNMQFVITDSSWDVKPSEGSEIGIYNKEGALVGSAEYSSPTTIITVWGDDATTVSKDGLALAENVTFKVWSNNLTASFEVANWVEGSASYDANAINVASAIVTNVLADVIATERVLVKVINVLGQEVISNEESFKGEVLFNVYNDGTVEKVVK